MSEHFILTSQGHRVYLDREDWLWAREYRWHLRNGYAARKDKLSPYSYRTVYLAREIAVRAGMLRPDRLCSRTPNVRHLDSDPLNDERANLIVHEPLSDEQVAGYEQQRRTLHLSPGRCRNRSGYKGVSWNSGNRRWQVMIQIPAPDGFRNLYLGQYDDPEEAAVVYDAAVLAYWNGEGYTNLIPNPFPARRMALSSPSGTPLASQEGDGVEEEREKEGVCR